MKFYCLTKNLNIQNSIQKVALKNGFIWNGKRGIKFLDFVKNQQSIFSSTILFLNINYKTMTHGSFPEANSNYYKKISIKEMFLVAQGRYFNSD